MHRFAFCFAILLSTFAPLAHAADRPPNVIIIFTDNHGAWTLGCYGNKDIRTPNVDRMAAEGMRFEHAFANNPVCSPKRATLRTPTEKFIERFGDEVDEHYDLARDPGEENNFLAPADKHAALSEKLNKLFAPNLDPRFDLWRGGKSQVQPFVFPKRHVED